MLVNSNYRYGGGGIGSSLIIEGYYNNSKFYQDNSFTTEIDGESGKLYVDLSTNKAYRWDGSIFTAFNADTVDGLHANGFVKVNTHSAYDCNTLYDTGIYLCGNGTANGPNGIQYGSLLVMTYRKPYGNACPDYCAQIFIPNGDDSDTSMWYRTSLQNTWNEWKRSCDGGNADTVDGKHASDFVRSLNGTEMVNIRLQIPSNVNVGNWLYENAKTGILYFINTANTNLTGLPNGNCDWAWFNFDGNNFWAKTIDNKMFVMKTINAFNGWIELITSENGVLTGTLVAQSNTAYSTPQVRNATMSTSAPSGGSNGQIHFQYS